MSFEIIIDTGSSLSYQYLKENNVRIISFKYCFGDNEQDTFIASEMSSDERVY